MKMRLSSYQSFLLVLALSRGYAQDTSELPVHLPSQEPSWAKELSPHLAGFSIEMDRWTDWAGDEIGKPNEYVNQLLHNLGQRTGHMPFIRVGANSQDRATLDLNFQVINMTFPPPTADVPNPEADQIYIGRDFYALSGNLPPGTPFMWGLNLKDLNQTETVAQARHLAEAFQGSRAHLTKDVHLINVEIGNEPDFYGPTPTTMVKSVYGPSWNLLNYTYTWQEYARAISREIEFGCPGSDKPTLSPGAFTSFNLPQWTTYGPLISGLLEDNGVRSHTSQFTGHAYSGGFSAARPTYPGELMAKLSVRNNMTLRIAGIEAVEDMGLKFVLGETNSYANHGIPELSNTVESAIWAVDWLLFGASSGVERMHFHHGVGYRYNLIQPTRGSGDGLNISRPHILPSYYSFLIVNEVIGKSGNAYIAEIPTVNDTMTAYGIWENGNLARLVLLNSQVYLGEGEKPSIDVHLGGFRADRPATFKLLTSNLTTSHTGLTWGGQNFETESGKPEGKPLEHDIERGIISLPASSVARVTFKDRSY